jgi:hypothetical protein
VAEAPLAAELSGRDLVVLRRGALSVYDTADSALMHVWPVPDVPSGGPCRTYVGECVEDVRLQLLGAARGLALYLVDGTAHVLNLRDGREVAVVRADTARLTSAGLFYARTVAGTYPGRVRFVPFGKLPARG